MSYAVHETATVACDHEALANMRREVEAPGIRVALIGFNEYAKHLLNWFPDKIAGVYDEETWKIGIKFQGREVASHATKLDIDLIVVCEYSQLYAFTGKIRALYDKKVRIYYPPRMHYKPTVEINAFEQDGIYNKIDFEKHPSPISMMEPNKLKFLSELMRAGLKNEGDIIEMGCYQGGSVWHLGHVLKNLEETRTVYMFDVFETHMMHPNATLCNDEIDRRLSFYPHSVRLEALLNDRNLLDRIRRKKIRFAHYDLGFIPEAVAFIWDHLQPDSPLALDNYGHIAIEPWDLDDFFEARGAHIIRLP